jgi:hypothetical protein
MAADGSFSVRIHGRCRRSGWVGRDRLKTGFEGRFSIIVFVA